MRNLLLFIIILCTQYNYGYTTTEDTLIYLNDLNFVSQQEKDGFIGKLINSEHDLMHLIINAKISSPSQSLEWFDKQYDQFLINFQNEKFRELKTEKKIKAIYSTVHDKLLKKYNAEVTFEEIFINGNYNCVTATMLYGLILTHFNIPFEIKETPEHVFLVAKGENNKSILMESTNPLKGTINYNQSFKDEFVKYIQESKLATASEVMNLGVDSVFRKFYFPEKSINLRQMAGIQYYNNAISPLADKKFEVTLDQLMKSHYLYPTEKSRYLIMLTLSSLLANTTYLNENDWKYYVIISRISSDKINTSLMNDEFTRLTQLVFVEKSDILKYQEAYNYISGQIADSVLKAKNAYVFNYQMGRYYLILNRFKEAFPYIEAAFKLSPDNFEIKTVFINTLMAVMDDYEGEEGIAKIEGYYSNYKNLRDDLQLSQVLLMSYLYIASEKYSNEKWSEGDNYLSKFEKMMESEQKSVNGQIYYQMEEVYTRVAGHYFKYNNNKKAKEYILRGLKYYPDSYRLKNSLKMM